MSKGLRLMATGAASLVVLLAGSGFATRGSAGPIPGRFVAHDLHTGAVRFDVPTASIHTAGAGRRRRRVGRELSPAPGAGAR